MITCQHLYGFGLINYLRNVHKVEQHHQFPSLGLGHLGSSLQTREEEVGVGQVSALWDKRPILDTMKLQGAH